ncbi:sterol desaturase family protein [Aquabacterium sp.]|uniref:sterol desaturase family protein n=1 Tax=Aquabacterium sp. TaxID=1872578 RepID=UPI00248930CA|nr:sterol desaturase family protein [Aquabacterium sp.]MDI1260876.1 sterol desaturase family protein [Aquabacterium sp.]
MTDFLHALYFILIAGSVFIGLVLLERRHLIRQQRPDAYDTKETLANFSTGVLYKVVDGVFIALVVTVFYDWVRQWGLSWRSPSVVLDFALVFVLTDLLFYWAHRFMHRVRFGWSAHAVHHSSERYNLSTALRQTPMFDLSGVVLLSTIPQALIGFDKNLVVLAFEMNLFYQFFIHTEVVRRLPAWFEYLFNTPSHHRVHHGRNPRQIDTNFGGTLIIWDRLFGTFVDEREAGEIRYGVSARPPRSLNPLHLVFGEFLSMWVDAWRHRDLRIVWKHPDWVNERYPSSAKAFR